MTSIEMQTSHQTQDQLEELTKVNHQIEQRADGSRSNCRDTESKLCFGVWALIHEVAEVVAEETSFD